MTQDLRASSVHIDSVTKSYLSPTGRRVTALDPISYEIRPAEFICLLGPSGCGKSTLLNIIAGLDSADAGNVIVDARSVTRPARERGVVFQDYALFPWLSVFDNIAFGPQLAGKSRREIKETTGRYIELMGLNGFERHLPNQLSGGMRQRVAIARALANHPRVLLMDEPFAAVDAQTRYTLQQELVRVWSRERITVVFVTHNIEEALILADRVLVLTQRPGRIKRDVAVDLVRPRNVTSDEFNAYRKVLFELMQEEIASKPEDQPGRISV